MQLAIGRFWTFEALEPIRRFPLPALFAVLAMVFSWTVQGLAPRAASNAAPAAPLMLFCAGAFAWSWAAALWGEARGSGTGGIVAGIAGSLLLALVMRVDVSFAEWLPPDADASNDSGITYADAFLLSALMLAPSLAPFLFRNVSPSAVWQFHHKWLLGLAMGWIGSLLATGGVAAVLATSAFIFEKTVPGSVYGRIYIIAATLVMPWIWLLLSPRDFREETKTGSAQDFTSRAVGLLVTYILVPVILALSALLIPYAVKVVAEGSYRTANAGLTTACGISVILVALLAWPQRADYLLIRLFWRLRPFLLIAPSVLLFPALWVRVAEDGWTPGRYVALILGLWLVSLLVFSLLARGEMRVISGTLAVLLLIGAFGPWSVNGLTAESQYWNLEALLRAKGLLNPEFGFWSGRGQTIKWDAPATTQSGQSRTVSGNDRQRAQSAIDMLANAGKLDRLRHWFEYEPDNPFERKGVSTYEALLRTMQLRFDPPPGIPKRHFFFWTSSPSIIPLPSGWGGIVAGPMGVRTGADTSFTSRSGEITLAFNGRVLNVMFDKAYLAYFDLGPLMEKNPDAIHDKGAGARNEVIMLDGSNPEKIRLAFTYVSAELTETSADIQVSAFALLPKPE